MTWYYLEKEYYDDDDAIEAVSIHYVCTPLNGVPDWENQGVTLYMPIAKPVSPVNSQIGTTSASDLSTPNNGRLRKKILKLPSHFPGPGNGEGGERYLLQYYFEICQDGSRHYSPLYIEEVVTSARMVEEALPR